MLPPKKEGGTLEILHGFKNKLPSCTFCLPGFTCATRSGKCTGCLILNVLFIIYTAKSAAKELFPRQTCRAWPQKTSLALPSKAKRNKLLKSLGIHPLAARVYVGHGGAAGPMAVARLATLPLASAVLGFFPQPLPANQVCSPLRFPLRPPSPAPGACPEVPFPPGHCPALGTF